MQTPKTNSVQAWILASRPKTLAGAAVPVLVGCGFAFVAGSFRWLEALLCLLFAFIMQIDANFINDYFDFVKGSDRADRLGPERSCAQGWITLKAMKMGIVCATILAFAVGLPLAYICGWWLIAIGAVCVLFAFLYTIGLSYHGFGDLLVIIFFGIVPVCFTFYVQTYKFSIPVLLGSLACGFAIDTLLMVNNYRDRDADKKSGKKTLVVRFGEKFGLQSYLLLGILATILCLSLLIFNFLCAAIVPMAYLVPHFFTWRKMAKIRSGKNLNLILGDTARNIFVFGILLTLGLIADGL